MARTSKRARRSSPLHLPGAFDLYKPSKELVLKNIWIFGPLYAVSLILGVHGWLWSPTPGHPQHWWTHAYGFGGSWPGSPLPSFDSALLIGFSLFWAVFVIIAGTIATIMSQAAQLDAAEHRHIDFKDLWQTCKQLGLRMLGLYIAITVIVVIGLVLLIIPGLIMARRYFLAPYVMLDKKTGIRDSLDESARLTGQNTGSIWGIFGVMILIGLIGIIPFIGGLLAFVIGMLYSVAPALRYHQLKKLRQLA